MKNLKNGSKIVKNENFQKKIFFCSFYVTLSLHAKNFDCTSIGVSCGQYKDKEEKTRKKTKKGSKNVTNDNFKKQTNFFKIRSLGLWKNKSFFTFLGPFFVFFLIFSSLSLYWPQDTPFDVQS